MEYYNSDMRQDEYSLHDMIDVDMSSDLEMYHQQMDVKLSPNSSSMHHIPNGPGSQNGHLPYGNEAMAMKNGYMIAMPNKAELDSSTGLSNWLQNGNSGRHLSQENGNPNLIVNPQTVSPVSNNTSNNSVQSSITSRMLSLPNSVQISGGNIQYVSAPTTAQQVFIATTKSSSIMQQPPTQANVSSGFQKNGSSFLLSPSSAPSSTVVDNPFPKPAYSYSCLIAMALKNSKNGSLPVAEIYNFMTRHFPYFKTAPDGWKNSVRHNLSLNKCFEKIENPNSDGTNSRKGCLWALNPAKMKKMDEEIIKWNKKDPSAIKRAMAHPEILEVLEQGQESYLSNKYQVGRHNPLPPVHQQHQGIHQMAPQSPSIRVLGSSPLMTQASAHQQHITIIPGSQTFSGQAMSHGHLPSIEVHKYSDEGNNELFAANGDLQLDPSLSDIAIQTGVWDDLPNDIFDIPLTHSPTAFLMSPRKLSPAASPGHQVNGGSATLQMVNGRQNGTNGHDFTSSRVVSAT